MTNVQEIWVPLYQYEDKFQISNYGRIRNLSNKILKSSICKKGYQNIRLFVNKKSFKSHKVHRLVMNSFSDIKNQPQVNHINGIKHDNRYENLEWSNNSHNIKHAWQTGLFKPVFKKGIQSNKSKYFVHKEYGIFSNINELSELYKVYRSKIRLNKIISTKYIEI